MPIKFFLRGATGQLYAVTGPFRIGREPECQIQIDNNLISRIHASVWLDHDHLLLRDERSRNGTQLNGQPLAQPDQLCPKAGPDTKLWVDEAQGFCLLYPADFALSADIPGEIIGSAVLSDTHDWGKVYTSLTLGAYDQPPSQIQKPAPPETNVDPSTVVTTTIGGANAVTYDIIGAPWRQHTADILFRVSRYTMVGPWDGQVFPRGAADARRLWDTVTKSIVFFEKWR